jgi:hypothetical protein
MFLYVNTAKVSGAVFSFLDGFRGSLDEPWSITTLVAPQRQAGARKYVAPLQDMKF